MDQNEYRNARESGELVSDADLQNAETEILDDQDQDEPDNQLELDDQDQDQDEQDQVDASDPSDSDKQDSEDEDTKLTPKEKTAFEKRLGRERVKLEEKLRKEIEEQSEQKYSKHKEAIEAFGGDPDKIIAAARDAKIQQEAQVLAERNGWTPEDTQWYIEDQRNKQELKELRVQMQINRLKDQPDYLGIDRMEKDILAKIDRSNGALTVEEAFWALGGPKRVEQVKLEVQQREVVRRNQATRTVVKDAPSTSVGETPLPPSVLAEAKKMGISEAEARRLMNGKPAETIDEWRERRKQAK